MTTTATCDHCGVLLVNTNSTSDQVRLSQIRYSRTLCAVCFRKAKVQQLPNPNKQQEIADRVGADIFECTCGAVVPMHESVRKMLKGKGAKIQRVCQACSTEQSCISGEHVLLTPNRPGWSTETEKLWTFQPIPDEFPRAICTTCKLQLHYDGLRWRRMTWSALSAAWQKVEA